MTKFIKTDKIAHTTKESLILLKTINLRFCVVGSLLCHHYLNGHTRYTKDIDIIFDDEFENIKNELIKVFGKIDFSQEDENEFFYEPSFTAFTQINGERVQIEGKRIKFFNEVETDTYEIDGVSFKGAKIEYAIAEKLVSLLCELSRPYKHLVDIYSFTQIDQAKEFNQLAVEDSPIQGDAKKQKIGGLGILIVKNTMSDYSYQRINDKNILVLKKSFE